MKHIHKLCTSMRFAALTSTLKQERALGDTLEHSSTVYMYPFLPCPSA